MPLLNKKPLELHRYNKKLDDDAEVFYCKYTNEIFEDYEEYCQRVIACNSLIWTCAITGKTNLTYQEALASEQNALKAVKDFPLELRNPILYLASKSNRRNLNDLMNDVFSFVKDRYFLGESVEACFDGVWVFAHVLQVILPTKEEVEEYKKQNNITGNINSRPYPGVLYKYEVEQLDDDNEDASEVRILTGDKVRRIKGVYSKDKNKIYIKQFAEYKGYRWRVQKNILSKYSISSILFSHMFVGEPPIFDDTPTNEAKYSQQSIDMYLTKDKVKSKNNEVIKKKGPENVKDIQKKYQNTIDEVVEQARKKVLKQEALDDKAKKLEELRKKREQKHEERAKLASFTKEWQRKRDDLECEDLKVLPAACPVDCRVPNEHFGDFVMILEFFSCFRDVLKVKDYFPYGLKFELVERALVDVEIAGPFCDILQLLLNSIFTLQEQEDDEVKSTDRQHPSTDIEVDDSGDISMSEAVKLATIAAGWSKIYHGVPLNQLSLDAITVSEILRLHFLSSGGRSGERSTKWRYQERGGYTNTDDPCLVFRINEPHILRFLATKSVAELPVSDKIKVLTCLMNQIITYAELRDIIDERYEKIKSIKLELRNDQFAESRREKEIMAQKLKEKKEAKKTGKAVSQESEEKKQKVLDELSKKKVEFHKRAVELQKAAMECQIAPLGRDRAYRKFWMFNTIGGLFVEDNEEFPGSCLAQPTPTTRNIGNLICEDTTAYIRKLFEEERNSGSDKENEGNSSHPLSSPKKKLLSESNDLTNTPSSKTISPVKEEDEEKVSTLVCTGNRETCTIHTQNKQRPQWLFYHKESDIEELINCLNERGYREHRLRKALIESKDNIIPKLAQCPVNLLNRFVVDVKTPVGSTVSTRSQKGYENANLKYPPGTPVQEILELYIREIILDTEAKIFGGGLGTIKVKNREAWRTAIECRSYDKQDDNLTWRQYSMKKEKNSEKIKEEDTSRPDTPCSMDSSTDHDILPVKIDNQNQVVKDMATAVLQIARAVEPRYLRKPLYDEKKKEKVEAMERWESSLMSSTSFAQVYLHIATLENSVQWDRSALNAKCKVCRRGRDGENMLLCDSCDRGFHLYCLKPKLTSIPKGDWFCDKCRPKEVVEKKKRSRRLFSEESEGEGSEVESDDDLPLSNGRSTRRSRAEEVPKKRRYTKHDDDDDDNNSSDEPLSKIARSSRRSAAKKDLD